MINGSKSKDIYFLNKVMIEIVNDYNPVDIRRTLNDVIKKSKKIFKPEIIGYAKTDIYKGDTLFSLNPLTGKIDSSKVIFIPGGKKKLIKYLDKGRLK